MKEIKDMTEPELSRAVCEEVEDWKEIDGWWSFGANWFYKSHAISYWYPVSMVEHAFSVVNRMEILGFMVTMGNYDTCPNKWWVEFSRPGFIKRWQCSAPTLPRAICEAALTAFRATKEDRA